MSVRESNVLRGKGIEFIVTLCNIMQPYSEPDHS